MIGAPRTAVTIPCCICGTVIVPTNASNQCNTCLAGRHDLKDILNGNGKDELTVTRCRRCGRYEHRSLYEGQQRQGQRHQWSHLDDESPALLALCLRRIPALDKKKGGRGGAPRITIVDASWIWTEPHSMRLKLRLTVQAAIEGNSSRIGGRVGGGIDANAPSLQQRVSVELRIVNKQCLDCHDHFTNRTWGALVQLRQRRPSSNSSTAGVSRSGIAYVESELAKTSGIGKRNGGGDGVPGGPMRRVLRVEPVEEGLDFYLRDTNEAKSFVNSLSRIAPIRVKSSTSKLVSEDVKNNTANTKHTISCEMVPFCRDDLIVCDRQVGGGGSGGLGRLTGRLCLVLRTTGAVGLVDASPSPSTFRQSCRRGSTTTQNASSENGIDEYLFDLHPDRYWRGGKSYILVKTGGKRYLTRFVVLNIELCDDKGERRAEGDIGCDNNNNNNNNSNNASTASLNDDDDTGTINDSEFDKSNVGKKSDFVIGYRLAEVEVVRESDLGKISNSEILRCTTHLGNILQVGDIVLGHDLRSGVDAGAAGLFQFARGYEPPDIVLVRKVKKKDEIKDCTSLEGGNGVNSMEKDEEHPSAVSKKERRRQRKEEKKSMR